MSHSESNRRNPAILHFLSVGDQGLKGALSMIPGRVPKGFRKRVWARLTQGVRNVTFS